VIDQAEVLGYKNGPESEKLHREVAIVVPACGQEFLHFGLYAELLPKFPSEAFLGRLASLDLPAGEFPQAAKPIFYSFFGL